MENLINIINNSYVILGIIAVNIILIVLYISNNIKLRKITKEYRIFMKKIVNYCEDLNKELSKTIRKVGIVRYNAFKDTGSDLSFALALLNDNNDGVVLNGIYSREMSNIYAKPIKAGKSTYTISEKEQEAINKAIESNGYNIVE